MPRENPSLAAWLRKLVLVAGLLCMVPALKAADLTLLQQSTVDAEALTFASGDQTKFGNFPNGVTHQQFPMQTHRGYQYAIFYDDERQVCAGRRKLPLGSWEIIRFTDYNITNNDTHNVAVLGICANDGTIHLTWDHHVSDLHYRRSLPGVANDPEAFTWSPALFGPVTNVLGPIGPVTQVTYPRFVPMPNGNLMLYYRFVTSGNGDSMIRVYDGNTSQWSTSRGKFIDRQNGSYTFNGETSLYRYAYINGIGYGGNRLHCSWVWRDRFAKTDVNNQHDLCYAYSDDDGLTWNNSGGIRIAVTGSSFININSPGLIVYPVDPYRGAYNQNTQFAYPDGGIHVILPRYREGTSSTRYYHHHWRDAAGIWRFEELPYTGSRPELVGDEQRNLFITYTSGSNLRILKGVPNASFTAWSWSLIYNQNNPSNGGDGQIDLSRWGSERVLSVYHQERPASILNYGSGTPIDGTPTPLHVTDFQVSSQAAEPSPAHQSTAVDATSSLQWTAGLNAVSHRIYFGTDPAAVAAASTSSPEYKGQQSGTAHTPAGPLVGSTTYYWRIDEVETGGVVRTGLLWSFTVAGPQPLTISPLPGQMTLINTPTPALAFSISDQPGLAVSGESSNPLLVPNANIVFGGSIPNLTVTVTPTANQTGFADITVTVSNGVETSTATFRLTVVVPGAPVAHWALDEGSGTLASDSTGNGHSGTLLNGPSWSSDATRDTFVSFDGENDRIRTPFTYALSSTHDFTWAWWANQQSAGTIDDKAIMIGNRYPGAGGGSLEFIKFTPTAGEFASGAVEKHEYAAIAKDEWHHYAMTKTGTSYQWYVDGVQQGAPVTINYSEDTPLPFFIGGDKDEMERLGEHFHGFIDDVVLYDRALSPSEVVEVKSGIHSPAVPMATLLTGKTWTDSTAWTDNLPAHAGSRYIVQSTGMLVSPDGNATFPGNSLTVRKGGSLSIRSRQSQGTMTTVDKLTLEGGATFDAGDFAELIAGTQNNETNVIAGNGIATSGSVRFRGYAGSTGDNPRHLRVLSPVSAEGTIQTSASGETSLHVCFIDHPANTFSGIWESNRGAFEFASAGAVGGASISVLDHGELTIHGDWNQTGAILTVSDSPNARVHLNGHHWSVATLTLGSNTVPDGIYSTTQLRTMADAVFTGTGTLTVGNPDGLDTWRFTHFETTSNSGEAANGSDANSDGESNLLEYATAQDPYASTLASHPISGDPNNPELTYTCSKTALGEGFLFTVEWSDTLLPGSWSNTGVSETPESEDPEKRIVRASLPTGDETRRFFRLRVNSGSP